LELARAQGPAISFSGIETGNTADTLEDSDGTSRSARSEFTDSRKIAIALADRLQTLPGWRPSQQLLR
jgi:hypothetical protein